jgi:8-oxo-dGTP pyrophosphatase MutT (NUDIX family)
MPARDVTGPADIRPDIRPEVVASRIVHRGRVVTLRVDDVLLPDGRIVVREVVDHPGAVVIAALDANGCITLVRQYRHAVGDRLLELPAGTLEPGEEPLETAVRELREEAGLVAGRWDRLGTFFSSPGFLREEMHAFLARDLQSVPAEPETDEDITLVTRSLNALLERPDEVPDSKSLATLLLVERHLAAEASGDLGTKG